MVHLLYIPDSCIAVTSLLVLLGRAWQFWGNEYFRSKFTDIYDLMLHCYRATATLGYCLISHTAATVS